MSSNISFRGERPFVAQIVRNKGQLHVDRHRNLTRRYSALDNAVVGCIRFMMSNGHVGDTCELYHKFTGNQLGTVTLSVTGKLIIKWSWE